MRRSCLARTLAECRRRPRSPHRSRVLPGAWGCPCQPWNRGFMLAKAAGGDADGAAAGEGAGASADVEAGSSSAPRGAGVDTRGSGVPISPAHGDGAISQTTLLVPGARLCICCTSQGMQEQLPSSMLIVWPSHRSPAVTYAPGRGLRDVMPASGHRQGYDGQSLTQGRTCAPAGLLLHTALLHCSCL